MFFSAWRFVLRSKFLWGFWASSFKKGRPSWPPVGDPPSLAPLSHFLKEEAQNPQRNLIQVAEKKANPRKIRRKKKNRKFKSDFASTRRVRRILE